MAKEVEFFSDLLIPYTFLVAKEVEFFSPQSGNAHIWYTNDSSQYKKKYSKLYSETWVSYCCEPHRNVTWKRPAREVYRGGGGIARMIKTDWLSILVRCGCWVEAHTSQHLWISHIREWASENLKSWLGDGQNRYWLFKIWVVWHAHHEPGFTPILNANPKFMPSHHHICLCQL